MTVVIEAAMLLHAVIQLFLARMTEGRMTQVMRESNGFRQIFIEAKLPGDGPTNLRDFECVREAGAMMIVCLGYQHLRLVHQPSEGRRMDDAIAVPLVER